MRNHRLSKYIPIFFSFVLFACNSGAPEAQAKPPFPNPDNRFGPIKLSFEDTTQPEYRRMIQRLDSFYQVQTSVVGFSGGVLVGYKGKILYERYYGSANREVGIPVNKTSSIQLASVTKTFTGAAVLFLHQQKYLNIDDEVRTYLPQFPYPNITVRMLLCHRSGLPEYLHWYGKYVKDTKTPVYNDKILELMAKHKPPVEAAPNKRFKYCNTNYVLLALVIEKATGMRFKDFMREQVFQPLGMQHTFVYDPYDARPAYASYAYKGAAKDGDMFADGVYGDKGIYSSVEDMYRWDQSFYQNRFLSNETIEMAYGPCSFEMPGIKNYGLGWRMLCYPDGNKIIYHNGWWHSNNTSFYRFVQDNFTIIILGNKYTTSIYRQAPVIYSIVKGLDSAGNAFDAGE